LGINNDTLWSIIQDDIPDESGNSKRISYFMLANENELLSHGLPFYITFGDDEPLHDIIMAADNNYTDLDSPFKGGDELAFFPAVT